jgi:hypothetical protein
MILSSGCGIFFSGKNQSNQSAAAQDDKNQDNQNNSQNQGSTDSENGVDSDDDDANRNSKGVSAKYQGEELGFRALTYDPYGHPALSSPGIRIHTEKRHAGSLESTIKYSWDREDLVEVQVGNKDLYGKILKVIRVEIDGNLYRIVVRPEDRKYSTAGDNEIPARAFFYVNKGAIDPEVAKFIVETEDGKELDLE